MPAECGGLVGGVTDPSFKAQGCGIWARLSLTVWPSAGLGMNVETSLGSKDSCPAALGYRVTLTTDLTELSSAGSLPMIAQGPSVGFLGCWGMGFPWSSFRKPSGWSTVQWELGGSKRTQFLLEIHVWALDFKFLLRKPEVWDKGKKKKGGPLAQTANQKKPFCLTDQGGAYIPLLSFMLGWLSFKCVEEHACSYNSQLSLVSCQMGVLVWLWGWYWVLCWPIFPLPWQNIWNTLNNV